MPSLVTGQLEISFTGSLPASRHTSLEGAKVAIVRARSQAARMLGRYLEHGPMTDTQMASALGLPEARISARRSMLIRKGLVAHSDIISGPFRAKVCRWALTIKGVSVAGWIRSQQR